MLAVHGITDTEHGNMLCNCSKLHKRHKSRSVRGHCPCHVSVRFGRALRLEGLLVGIQNRRIVGQCKHRAANAGVSTAR